MKDYDEITLDEIEELNDMDLDEIETTEEIEEEKEREKEIEELKKQKKQIDIRLRELKTKGFTSVPLAKIGKDVHKGIWRLSVLSDYYGAKKGGNIFEKTELKQRWNPVMEAKTADQMKQKLEDLIVALGALKKLFDKK